MKRGYYWLNKTRDSYTIKRITESKYKKLVQYDINGNHVKTWESILKVSTEVFNNETKSLYSILNGKNIKTRLRNNSYWFKEEELLKIYGEIPNKLNIIEIEKKQKQELSNKFLNKKINPKIIKYCVHQYDDNGKKINTYPNVFVAADKLNVHYRTIRRICNDELKKPKFNLKYGKKIKSINYK